MAAVTAAVNVAWNITASNYGGGGGGGVGVVGGFLLGRLRGGIFQL